MFVTEAELPAAGPLVPSMHRVVDRRRELHDTVTLTLEPIDRHGSVPASRPGQFNMVWVPGVGEIPLSASACPSNGTSVHTVRAVGAVSARICEADPGDVLGVRGPFGTDWAIDEAQGADLLIVAGGIGLAPLRPAMQYALANRSLFERVIVLVGARSPDSLLFEADLSEWRGHLDADVEVTVDAAPPSWRGDVGVVTSLLGRIPFDAESGTALVCGPEVMMRLTAEALVAGGLASDRLRVSLERNMACAVGHCGRCQVGAAFVCLDGPVFTYERARHLMAVREL